MGLKIGVCGFGVFAPGFMPLFQHHPEVEEVVVAEMNESRRASAAARFGLKRTFDSLDALCASDVDAIAIFTQRQLHGEQAIRVLESGKHVYSAVPPALSIEMLEKLVTTVERTGLVYMSGETSLYYPWTLYCKQRFERGDFGRFVYAQSQYNHDMDHMYASFQSSGGDQWKRVAGIPPMYYPTHSVSMPLAVTGARVTHVSCLGVVDQHEDGIFREGANDWDNVFSNQIALMRTSDGGAIRCNEMRRVGWPNHYDFGIEMDFFGTEATFEMNPLAAAWVTKTPEGLENVSDMIKTTPGETLEGALGEAERLTDPNEFAGVAKVHPVDRLPDTYRGLPNGHHGSHQFLIDDFITAMVRENTMPPGNVWDSANWCAAGLVAHASAKREGEMMPVPTFGSSGR